MPPPGEATLRRIGPARGPGRRCKPPMHSPLQPDPFFAPQRAGVMVAVTSVTRRAILSSCYVVDRLNSMPSRFGR